MKHGQELDFSAEPPGEAVDLAEALFVPLWRSKYLIILAALVGMGVGAFQAAIQSNTYDATGKLLVRAGAREEGTAEARVSPTSGGGFLSAREAVSNELHLLTNPKVFEGVARRVGPERVLAPYDPAAQGPAESPALRAMHDFQAWWFRVRGSSGTSTGAPRGLEAATQTLMRSIRLHAEYGSNVITVTCTTHSPQLSVDLVNAFIAEALVHHQEVFSSDSSIAFLDEQVMDARVARSRAEAELSDYRVMCGFFDAEAQRGHLLEDLHTLQMLLNEDLARLATLASLEETLQGEVSREAARREVSVERAPRPNPTYDRLQQRIFELRFELLDVERAQDLTPARIATERERILQQLAKAEEELQGAPEFLDAGTSIVEQDNPRYERLRERLDTTTADLVALRSGTAKREQRLAEVEELLAELERCGPTLSMLETEARQTNLQLDQFLAARLQVGVLDMLDNVNLINLLPLQYAKGLPEKTGPRRGRSVILGALLGVATGFGLALVRPRLDRRLRSPEDVRRLLGNVALAVIPETRSRGKGMRGRAPAGGRR